MTSHAVKRRRIVGQGAFPGANWTPLGGRIESSNASEGFLGAQGRGRERMGHVGGGMSGEIEGLRGVNGAMER